MVPNFQLWRGNDPGRTESASLNQPSNASLADDESLSDNLSAASCTGENAIQTRLSVTYRELATSEIYQGFLVLEFNGIVGGCNLTVFLLFEPRMTSFGERSTIPGTELTNDLEGIVGSGARELALCLLIRRIPN